MRPLLRAWDQGVLMRCPVLWQLRLHWFVPLAVLWAVLLPWMWLAWAAEPARWMGSAPGIVTSRSWQTPEQGMLSVSTAIAWMGSLGLAFTWLVRVRVHNRWRECAPAARLGVWAEYLWGAALMSLLFAPALALDTLYPWRVQQRWDNAPVGAYQMAARSVGTLELLVNPRNAAALVEWVRTLEPETASIDREDQHIPANSLRWLIQGDAQALGQQLEQFGAALRPWGYTPSAGTSTAAQAAALQAAFQAALQSPLAQEWRRYREQHPPQPGQEDTAEANSSDCLMQRWQRAPSRAASLEDPAHCFAAYAKLTDTQWQNMLQSVVHYSASREEPRIVQWQHPRYGMALPSRMASHLSLAERTDETPWRQRQELLTTASAGFFAALALVIARLMSVRQIAVLAGGLVLTLPAVALLGMLGLTDSVTLPLIPAVLLALAWVRIALLRRPWGGSLLLGLTLALGMMGVASLWDAFVQSMHLGTYAPHTDRPLGSTDRWINLLLGVPAVALGAAALVGLTAPLWRRWRGLPER